MQIKTTVTDEEAERLDEIISEYKFKSRYELGRVLMVLFIREHAPEADQFNVENIRCLFNV